MANKVVTMIDLELERTGRTGRRERAVLNLETDRGYRGGIESEASVYWAGSDGGWTHAMGLGSGCGDFDVRVKITPAKRVTQKMLETQHAEVFTPEATEELVARAKAYYENGAGAHELTKGKAA